MILMDIGNKAKHKRKNRDIFHYIKLRKIKVQETLDFLHVPYQPLVLVKI